MWGREGGGRKGDASESLGHGLRVCCRSVEDWERRPIEKWVRSNDKARAAREKRGVNHDFGGILARDGMRFYPRRYFLRSFVRSRCNVSFFSIFYLLLSPASFFSSLSRSSSFLVLSTLFTLLHLQLTPIF